MGISVKIQLPHDHTGREGVSTKLPDVVIVRDPKHIDSADSNKTIQPFAQNVGQGQHHSNTNQQQQQQQSSNQPQTQHESAQGAAQH